jgi:two-component system alkaline phosphatase synthesis response regulator PhoP
VSPQPRRHKQLVLIVDDDLASRELLANYLEPEGYAVVLVSSGTQAIEEAQKSLPDLIVTDVLMPGPGGLQTLFVLKHAGNLGNTCHRSLRNQSQSPRPNACSCVPPKAG